MKKTAKNKADQSKKTKKRAYKTFKQSFSDSREKVWDKKRARLKLHHSFRRSYREDYRRGFQVPGLLNHAMTTLKIVFKNWRLFLPLIAGIVAANIIFVGLMSESTYETVQDSLDQSYEALQDGELGRFAKAGLLVVSTVTSGGLSNSMTEVQQLFIIIFAISAWLITIYYLRNLLAGNKPKFRDGVYNAMTPVFSTLCVIALVFIHLIPAFIFVIAFSAAVQTDFLSQPLYCFIFWLFGLLLLLLSSYLLPGSILAMVATSVPGIYPMAAINATTDLIQGRRTRFIIRLVFLVLFIAVIWIIVMLPLTYLDLILKDNILAGSDLPIIPFALQVMTTFSVVYATAYIYLLYRRMLDDPTN